MCVECSTLYLLQRSLNGHRVDTELIIERIITLFYTYTCICKEVTKFYIDTSYCIILQFSTPKIQYRAKTKDTGRAESVE